MLRMNIPILIFFGSEVDRIFISSTVALMRCRYFIRIQFEACIVQFFYRGVYLDLVWSLMYISLTALLYKIAPLRIFCCLMAVLFFATSGCFRSMICSRPIRSPWSANTLTWQLCVVGKRFVLSAAIFLSASWYRKFFRMKTGLTFSECRFSDNFLQRLNTLSFALKSTIFSILAGGALSARNSLSKWHAFRDFSSVLTRNYSRRKVESSNVTFPGSGCVIGGFVIIRLCLLKRLLSLKTVMLRSWTSSFSISISLFF